MILYPEEIKDNEMQRKVRKLRYVIYECGCKVFNIFVVPWVCSTHRKGIRRTGPMFMPSGDPFFIDSRHIC